jgi:2'-5' RNA ligase
MGPQRLFLALPLPETVRRLLHALTDRSPLVRWTPEPQLHITLRFLGDVSDEETSPLLERLRTVSVRSFPLTVEGVGAFPPKGAPRVLWVGVGPGHPRLHQLRQRVDDAVLGAGVPMDVRTFHPHVTLGRCLDRATAEASRWLRTHQEFAGPTFAVEAFELYASELHALGAIHTLIERFPLASTVARRDESAS